MSQFDIVDLNKPTAFTVAILSLAMTLLPTVECRGCFFFFVEQRTTDDCILPFPILVGSDGASGMQGINTSRGGKTERKRRVDSGNIIHGE